MGCMDHLRVKLRRGFGVYLPSFLGYMEKIKSYNLQDHGIVLVVNEDKNFVMTSGNDRVLIDVR